MINQVRRATAHASVGAMVLALLTALLPIRAAADDAQVISFVNGATFFSQVTQAERAMDPQVFVYDALVAVGTGPERIEHVAGLRNARLDDVQLSALYNAEGVPLGLTLKKWLAARGTLERQTLPSGRDRVIASFKHLIPFGTYSLFVERLGEDGRVLTARPMDADGSASSFEAHVDGSAMLVLEGPPLAPGSAVALLYHSDGREHGVSRGLPGVATHEQLVARI